MKSFAAQLYILMRHRPSRISILTLLRFLGLLTTVVVVYSILFHYIMAWEGRTEFSWMTGFYWTLTVMSTLGFGDITFDSDLGRLFSTVVLLSGIIFLLVLFPFTFIEFFYAPWAKAQAAARAPSELPPQTRDHVVLTALDAVTAALIAKLTQYQYPYVLLVSNLDEALKLFDLGYKVVLGDLDNPETYRKVRVENALVVATTANDMVNTNVAFTVREISPTVPIISTANFTASIDILELAGSSVVMQLGAMLGQALARRVSAGDTLAHAIGEFGPLVFAEATVGRTPLVGKTLAESRLREEVGMSVLGVWERGRFQVANAQTRITPGTVLVLAGSAESIQRYNQFYCNEPTSNHPIIIIGGGRVGRATGRALAARGLDYRIVEQLPERIRDPRKYVLGNAAELAVLERAGIMGASTVVVTTHQDDTNIYLTIYCRRLRPDIQIISRATLDRNVDTLHRAGADFVMSYASMGANAILNYLGRGGILMVAEGLEIFKVEVPRSLAGKSIAEAAIRHTTGCSVIALETAEGTEVNPDPHKPLPASAQMILIGAIEAEKRFLQLHNHRQ